jgi:sec-independent protein translocase protein TatC
MSTEPAEMSFLGHFNELRKRLLIAVLALAVTTMASFAMSQYIAEFLAQPVGGLKALVSIEVTENLSAFMKISLLSGFVFALPVILYEVMAFIMPGLEPRERRWIWFVIPTATIFFVTGVAFAYFIMLPAALPFMLSFMGITTLPRPSNYFGFIINLLFWVGVSFETPLIIMVLARLGIVNARQLAKQWRIAIVVSAVLAAVITPTFDPVNMGILMIPLVLLYTISILFAAIAGAGRNKSQDLAEGEASPEDGLKKTTKSGKVKVKKPKRSK